MMLPGNHVLFTVFIAFCSNIAIFSFYTSKGLIAHSEEDPWFAIDENELEMEKQLAPNSLKPISKIHNKYASEYIKFNPKKINNLHKPTTSNKMKLANPFLDYKHSTSGFKTFAFEGPKSGITTLEDEVSLELGHQNKKHSIH